MKLLSQKQIRSVAGGVHTLTVVINAPSNDVGIGVGDFVGNLINGNIKTSQELINSWDFLITEYLYLIGVQIESLTYA
jgi:hypothetical protein